MNLVELLVATSLVLGSATASLGIWARTAQASHAAAQQLRQELQADERLLGVQAHLQALAADQRAQSEPPPPVCPDPAALQPVLDPAAPGPALELELDAAGEILTARVATEPGQRRQRVFDLLVYGLCTGAS